jgi:predicted enzyme related to lactoylglutathione lyase
MPTIVHFEIPSDNVEKTRKFYSDLFGWNIEKWTEAESMPEGMDYWTVTTTDDKGNKAIGGGLMKRQNPQQQGITNYIDVSSVDEYASKVERLGGKVVVPKMPVKGWVILQCVLIQKIIRLGYGRQIAKQSDRLDKKNPLISSS